jgi:hypothetical protein
VHEDERRPDPADRIAKPSSVPHELALVESLQPVFAIRHHRGIFFG